MYRRYGLGGNDGTTHVKVERSVDGLCGCHDGLRDDLTSKDAYQVAVTSP